jgi:hypothetical protein
MAGRQDIVIVLAALAALSGCSKSEPRAAATTGGSGQTGQLSPWSVETLRGLYGLAKVGDPWEPARSRLDAHLGTSIYAKETEQIWAVAVGDSCWMTSLEVEDGAVKAVKPPTELKAADGSAFQHCMAAAGRNKCHRDGASLFDCTDRFPTAP